MQNTILYDQDSIGRMREELERCETQKAGLVERKEKISGLIKGLVDELNGFKELKNDGLTISMRK